MLFSQRPKAAIAFGKTAVWDYSQKKSVAVANRNRISLESSQQRAVLRKELEMTALWAFEYHIAALHAIRKKSQLGENVAVDLVLAAQALDAAGSPGDGFFARPRKI